MSKLSRRRIITTGLGAAAGVSGLAVAARLANQYGLIPPDHHGLYGVGETLTYASMRLLMSQGSKAREFDRGQITPVPHPNYPGGGPPNDEAFERLRDGRFADWTLTIDGLVTRPTTLSLADLKALPSSNQITQLACEEGWSFIAEWIGTPIFRVLDEVGVRPEARYLVYYSHQEPWWDSLHLTEALHPQTILAYGMNGSDLPLAHGAPIRLRIPHQLGYKSLKHLNRITLTDDLKQVENGLGSLHPEFGFSWYAGI